MSQFLPKALLFFSIFALNCLSSVEGLQVQQLSSVYSESKVISNANGLTVAVFKSDNGVGISYGISQNGDPFVITPLVDALGNFVSGDRLNLALDDNDHILITWVEIADSVDRLFSIVINTAGEVITNSNTNAKGFLTFNFPLTRVSKLRIQLTGAGGFFAVSVSSQVNLDNFITLGTLNINDPSFRWRRIEYDFGREKIETDSVAINASGRAIYAYTIKTGLNFGSIYATFFDGGSWSQVVKIAAISIFETKVGIDQDNHFIISWGTPSERAISYNSAIGVNGFSTPLRYLNLSYSEEKPGIFNLSTSPDGYTVNSFYKIKKEIAFVKFRFISNLSNPSSDWTKLEKKFKGIPLFSAINPSNHSVSSIGSKKKLVFVAFDGVSLKKQVVTKSFDKGGQISIDTNNQTFVLYKLRDSDGLFVSIFE